MGECLKEIHKKEHILFSEDLFQKKLSGKYLLKYKIIP